MNTIQENENLKKIKTVLGNIKTFKQTASGISPKTVYNALLQYSDHLQFDLDPYLGLPESHET